MMTGQNRWTMISTWGAPFLASTLLLSGHARADAATAEALFREGRKLLQDGKTSLACDKFAASQREDPSSGTMLNLADCHSKAGKTASAWAEFLTASRMAKNQNDMARSEEAARRAKDLEAALSHVSVKITLPIDGLQIRKDDVVLEEAILTTDIPVDGGPHTISASAPGYKTWSKSISVGMTQDHVQVVVPALEKDPNAKAVASTAPSAAPLASSAPPPVDTKSGHSPTLGYVLGGAGIVVAGVGTFFGLKALSTYKDAENLCGGSHSNCPQGSADKDSSANTQANIANIAIPLGLIGVGFGTYWILTAHSPKSEGASISVAPYLGLSSGGASMSGRF